MSTLAPQYNSRACNAMHDVMDGGYRSSDALGDDLEAAVAYCIDAVPSTPQGYARRSIFADGFRIEGVECYDDSPAFFPYGDRP